MAFEIDRLDALIDDASYRKSEIRDYVPFTHTHRIMHSLINDSVSDPKIQEEFIAGFDPFIDSFILPKTATEFQALKRSVFDMHETIRIPNHASYHGLFLELCKSLNILLERNIQEEGSGYGDYLWSRIEGDYPVPSSDISLHENPESIRMSLNERGHKYYKAGVGRVGLIFGDFRVAHDAHVEFIKAAKLAVGRCGELVIVTPTKRTILATTDKNSSLEDATRYQSLAVNRFVDHLCMVDMPESYYSHPSDFWEKVWETIHPDLFFLGEENHPLQSFYENLTYKYGGILVIDAKPITRRSGDVLRIT